MASSSPASPRHYFAYGSNLHITQMAQRCPKSVFLGKARLLGYRWQINQRGVANVVESSLHVVEGLIFLIKPSDEHALDRSEGVAKSLYMKKTLPVDFQPHARYANLKSSELAQRLARPLTPEGLSSRPRSSSSRADVPRRIEALVYVSDNFKLDGHIRDEYIQRMEKAAADAVALGVSHAFIDHVIRPHLLPGLAPALQPEPTRPSSRGAPALPYQYQAPSDPNLVFNLPTLREDNRRNQVPPALPLPEEMFDAVTANAPRRPPGRGSAHIYLVRTQQESSTTTATSTTVSSTSTSSSHIQKATPDLELANELAIFYFQSLWIEHIATSRLDSFSDSPLLNWRLEGEDGRLWIRAVLPGGDGKLTVWVEGVGVAVRE